MLNDVKYLSIFHLLLQYRRILDPFLGNTKHGQRFAVNIFWFVEQYFLIELLYVWNILNVNLKYKQSTRQLITYQRLKEATLENINNLLNSYSQLLVALRYELGRVVVQEL